MSFFSAVDDADHPNRAVMYLDRTAHAATGMKHYAVAKHAQRRPQGMVLDLGCGSGHDLVLLANAGITPTGVDPSAVLLAAARERTGQVPLVRSIGEALPFGDGTLAGCRIERVLIHVEEPIAVLQEVVRCLRSGALLTVFEPDWSRYRVHDETGDESAAWIAPVRHPGMGGELWSLLEDAGLLVLDRVEELSVWRRFATLNAVIDLPAAIHRAVSAGRIDQTAASEWMERQNARDERGEFYSMMSKVMVIAEKS
jgi:SAM-dependent methyltransferase